jgi:hypothetical protein
MAPQVSRISKEETVSMLICKIKAQYKGEAEAVESGGSRNDDGQMLKARIHQSREEKCEEKLLAVTRTSRG